MPDADPIAAPRTLFRLSVITKRISELLLEAERARFWVKATFVPDKTRKAGGHVYGNLIEVNAAGTQVAKVRATIWRDDARKIENAFHVQGLPNPFLESQEICAQCSVRYHAVHGLTLTVFEVDPLAGESHVEQKRRAILALMEREGLLHANKSRGLGVIPLRIGLVTAASSAAYADFSQTLLTSSFAFQVTFAPAVMQGAETSRSIVDAIAQLTVLDLDLICIIRGGGSPLDLAWLDDEAIARCVAHCPIPVWVGIGHEIDVGVLDFLAHTSHKTPTAVAKTLVEQARVLADQIQLDGERLREICGRRIAQEQQTVERAGQGLRQGTRKHLQIQDERFRGAVSRLEGTIATRSSQYEAGYHQKRAQLEERVRRLIERSAARLQNAAESIPANAVNQLRATEERLSRNRTGLDEGTRKHLALYAEQYHRRAQRLVSVITANVDGRKQRLGTSAALVRERSSGLITRQFDRLRFQADSHLTPASLLRRVDAAAQSLSEKLKRLEALDPERLLDRGYSLSLTVDGAPVSSVQDVAIGATIHTRLRDGTLVSRVLRTEEKSE